MFNALKKLLSALWTALTTSPFGGATAPVYTIEAGAIPDVFHALKEQGDDGSFAVIMVPSSGQHSDSDALNIQFSIEAESLGLDWVLLSPINIEDQGRFIAYIEGEGLPVLECEMNDVSYLRVEEGDLPRLCQGLLAELYGIAASDQIEFFFEGATWSADV